MEILSKMSETFKKLLADESSRQQCFKCSGKLSIKSVWTEYHCKKMKACKRKVKTANKQLIADFSISPKLNQSFIDDNANNTEVITSKKSR